jgi:hypothetical protein
MAYRKFDTGTWQDPWFENLSSKAKLLFIYLWTNDVCNQAGCYQVTKRRIEFEVGFKIDDILTELLDKVEFFENHSIVWVKNFFKRQCQNESFRQAALKSISTMPYEVLRKFYHYNTMPPPCPHHVDTNPSSEAEAEAEAETETETETETEEKHSSEPCSQSEREVDEIIISIPLVTKNKKTQQPIEYPIYQKTISEFQELYPAVDIMQELRNLKAWNISNPLKRKTESGIMKHINTWLADKQNKGGSNPRSAPIQSTMSPKQQHNARVLAEIIQEAAENECRRNG